MMRLAEKMVVDLVMDGAVVVVAKSRGGVGDAPTQKLRGDVEERPPRAALSQDC